jgi:hypothetical protein
MQARVTPAPSIEPRASRSIATKTELRVVAGEVVSEYLSTRPAEPGHELSSETRTELLERLLARCPGFSTRDYRAALTAAFAGRIRLVPGADSDAAEAALLGANRRPRARR